MIIVGNGPTCCAIMQFCMAHKLSYTAIGDLLNLLQLLVPTPNLLPTSVYRFKKFFQRFKIEYTYTNYFSNCDKIKEECCCDHPTCNSHLAHIPVEKSLFAVLLSKTFSLPLHMSWYNIGKI